MTAPALTDRDTAQRPMRLSLVVQLALLLVAAVVLAVSVLGGVVAWNLRAGFSDYLRAQDEHWLERFALEAGTVVSQRGLAAISGPGSLRPLLDAVAPAGSPPPPGPRGDAYGPPKGREGFPLPGPGGPGAPPPRRMGSLVGVVDLQGRHLAGRRIEGDAVAAERPILVQGQPVAMARLAQVPINTAGIDAAFLARQYRGILLTAGALVLFAAAGAVWVGRRWLRPVRAVQDAARRIAAGQHELRLEVRGNDELSDLSRDIQAMAQALQQLESSRRRWIAELSHEMRTPLAVLRAEVDSLADGIRPVTPKALASLQEEVARVSRLVDDFHQLALSDLRALPCQLAPVQPPALLQRAAQRMAARAEAAGLQLHSEVAEAPPLARWDAQRIDQLLDNLLENSLRYTDAPGRIVLRLEPAGVAHAALVIEDSAPGVPPADVPRLFDPLYRADPSRSRRTGGSGLGLAICRAIVLGHGGRIEAAPSPLGGLQIRAVLPLNPDAAKASERAPERVTASP